MRFKYFFFFIPIALMACDIDPRPTFGEPTYQYYGDYTKISLNFADKYLAMGDLKKAKEHYECAKRYMGHLPGRAYRFEMRLALSNMTMKFMVNKDESAIRDFVELMISHAKRIDEKMYIDLDFLMFLEKS